MLRFSNPNPNVASGTVLKHTRAYEAPKSILLFFAESRTSSVEPDLLTSSFGDSKSIIDAHHIVFFFAVCQAV
jgi:hypothetical protein